jgi:hypothetical protein
MILIEHLPESTAGPVAGVVGPDVQAGHNFAPNRFNLFGRKSGLAQRIGRQFQDQVQVFGQAAAGKFRCVPPAGKIKVSAERFHGFINLIKAARSGSPHQHIGREGSQSGFFQRLS